MQIMVDVVRETRSRCFFMDIIPVPVGQMCCPSGLSLDITCILNVLIKD